MRHLRLRLVHDRARAEPARAAVRLVVPRGVRRGADPAGHRRPRGRELPGRAPPGRLRPCRRGRSDRGRGRAVDRQLLHDLLLLALVFAGEVLTSWSSCCSPAESPMPRQETCPRLDIVGTILSAARLGMLVFGVLRSSEWGWIHPEAGRAVVGGALADRVADPGRLFVIWVFSRWSIRRVSRGEEPLVRPGMLQNKQLSGGLVMFFFRTSSRPALLRVALPLGLPRALGAATAPGPPALGHAAHRRDRDPALLPDVSPRLVVRCGLFCCSRVRSSCSADSTRTRGPEVIFVLMLLVGPTGALASQPAASRSRPCRREPEVGGVQNTMTNLGASMGTALAGLLMIAAVASSFDGHPGEPDHPGRGRPKRRSSSRAACRSSRTPTSKRLSTRPAWPQTTEAASTPTRALGSTASAPHSRSWPCSR